MSAKPRLSLQYLRLILTYGCRCVLRKMCTENLPSNHVKTIMMYTVLHMCRLLSSQCWVDQKQGLYLELSMGFEKILLRRWRHFHLAVQRGNQTSFDGIKHTIKKFCCTAAVLSRGSSSARNSICVCKCQRKIGPRMWANQRGMHRTGDDAKYQDDILSGCSGTIA